MTDLHTHHCQCRQCKLHWEIERLVSLEHSALLRIEDMDSLPDDLGGCLYDHGDMLELWKRIEKTMIRR
jgi:hypothetical protein